MSKWLIGLLVAGGLLASTAARSIAQFEIKPASSSSQKAHVATMTASADAKTSPKFPQVGEVTAPNTVVIGWLIVVSGIWIWQGGRRHAA
ncbi:hypothetical protein [Lacticaseibacillus porcinae]|uniref:hypothetical protein n=1 Tax=Lacticaseibacillus porcinae TaxID=1123687 RepID=UPI000F7B5892|nr:hypothetical protein [Lacticaseibacillus porcinae]